MKKEWFKNIGVQVVIAMVLGILAGAIMGDKAAMFAPLGTIFIKLIKMLVIPLVAVAIISGATSLGNSQSAGKLGGYTLGLFGLTSIVAVAFSLAMGVIFTPGLGVDMTTISHMFSTQYADKGQIAGFWDTITGLIPDNIFSSLTNANIIQVLIFSMFFGIALTKVDKAKAKPIIDGVNTILDAMIWMINIVMKFAPVGVFGLMAEAVGSFGFSALQVVMNLFIVYTAAILIFGFVFYPLFVKILAGIPLKRFISAMRKPQVVAFSTASSMATLPVNMEVAEKELDMRNSTVSFVLPLGATINMTGGAIYYGLVAVFFAQIFQIDLTIGSYIAIILTATLGAVGQAGVPGPSFLVVAVLLAAGIPIEGLPLLFALDRIFDMLRTALNITGDVACGLVVDKWLGDENTQETAQSEKSSQA